MKLQATPVLKKNKAEGLILPNFKISYRAAAIKTALAQEKHADQQNRETEVSARACGQSARALRPLDWGRFVFSTDGAGTTGCLHARRMKVDLHLTLQIKIKRSNT